MPPLAPRAPPGGLYPTVRHYFAVQVQRLLDSVRSRDGEFCRDILVTHQVFAQIEVRQCGQLGDLVNQGAATTGPRRHRAHTYTW